MSDGCYFCGGGEDVLEQHHIIPQRMGGPDREENLVGLCPTCHRKLERLYDNEFFARIGAAAEAIIEENPTPEEYLAATEDAVVPTNRSDSLSAYDYVRIIRDEIGIDWDQCTACRRLLWILPADDPRNDGGESVCARCGVSAGGKNGRVFDD